MSTAALLYRIDVELKDIPGPAIQFCKQLFVKQQRKKCKRRKIKAKKAGLPIQMDLRHIPNRGRGQIGNPTNIS